MANLSTKDTNQQQTKIGLRVGEDGILETLDGVKAEIVESGPADFFLATGADARRTYGELAELRAQRLKGVGGSVFKRARSPYWQIKYRMSDGRWRYESIPTARSRREAEWWLKQRAFEASAGLLPGTANFEQIVDALIDDARVSGRNVARLEGAARALKARLAGCRAQNCDYSVWVKYAAERKQEVSADTVHLELAIAQRAYRLARAKGLVSSVPEFPKIRDLHVRHGFVDPRNWEQVRVGLRPDFRDAVDFAFLCGAREMEILTLTWADVELEARVIHLRITKTGRPRAVHYAQWPELAAVIERRTAARERLKRDGIITPWVFCFSEAVVIRKRQYHAAGAPMFKESGHGGLLAMLRDELSRACAGVGLPKLLFHDLRRSAARNFERAGIPRSVAMKLGGWSDKMYSRYAIGAESELASAGAMLSAYLKHAGRHFGGTNSNSSAKSRGIVAEGGRSRTFRQAYCPPSRF
jgi:integrase